MAKTDSTLPAFAPYVSVIDLARALGASRSTLLRAIDAGDVPDGVRYGGKRERRWSYKAAARIVAKAGRAVPAEWTGQTPAAPEQTKGAA